MPELRLVVASGTAQRRLLEETVKELCSKNYEMSARYEGGEWQSLLSDNMSGGLFDSNRFIIVENAEDLKELPEAFSSMVEENSSVVIVAVYSVEPSKFIPKSILSKCRIIKPKPYPRWPAERQRWVLNVAAEMNVKLSHDAAALMVELTEDPEEIRGQLQTLQVFKKDEAVNISDVEAFCLDDGSKNLLTLLDSLCKGDAVQAIKTFGLMKKSAEYGDLIRLITALHNRFRLAVYGGIFPSKAAAFQQALGARDYAWRLAQSAVKRYGRRKIYRFNISLIRLNVAEKTGTSSGWTELETAILELISK